MTRSATGYATQTPTTARRIHLRERETKAPVAGTSVMVTGWALDGATLAPLARISEAEPQAAPRRALAERTAPCKILGDYSMKRFGIFGVLAALACSKPSIVALPSAPESPTYQAAAAVAPDTSVPTALPPLPRMANVAVV